MKCTSCDREATHAPEICIPATGWPQDRKRALRMTLAVPMCRHCVRAFQASDVLDQPTPDGKSTFGATVPAVMARAAGSKLPPDVARAWVHHLPLDSDEYRDFERANRKSMN